MTTSLPEDLARRAEAGRPIRIGLIGAGEMGTDIVTQVSLMQGIEVAVLVTSRIEKAGEAFSVAGLEPDAFALCETSLAAERAIGQGRTAVCPAIELACGCDLVDVIIDATGRPNAGAQVAMQAIRHGKHIVMMNVEADVSIGPLLKHEAGKAGVVYTIGAGDEPSSTMELINFIRSLGYPIVAAGKGKNNAFNLHATPDSYREEAERRNMNPRMLVEFVDGSKTMIEMTAIANATGLVPDKPGMHGPNASLDELHKVLCPVWDGGILSRAGVVDFTIAKDVAPGVFVIAEMSHPRLRERMNDLRLGEGPYYTFYRPYHLTSLEVPLSAAEAVLYGKSHMWPLDRPVAETAALAKRDLAPGTRLDAIGEYCYRGWAITREEARRLKAVPLGLAHGAVISASIGEGEYLTYDNCRLDESLDIVQLRRKLDLLLDGDDGAVPGQVAAPPAA